MTTPSAERPEDGRPAGLIRSRSIAALLHLHAASGKSMAYRNNRQALVKSARMGAPCLLKLLGDGDPGHAANIIEGVPCDDLTMAQHADETYRALREVLKILQSSQPCTRPTFRLHLKVAIRPLRHLLIMVIRRPWTTEGMASRSANQIWLGRSKGILGYVDTLSPVAFQQLRTTDGAKRTIGSALPARNEILEAIITSVGHLNDAETALIADLHTDRTRMMELTIVGSPDRNDAERADGHLHDLLKRMDAGYRVLGEIGGEDRKGTFVALGAIHASMRTIIDRRTSQVLDDLRTQVRFTVAAHDAENEMCSGMTVC